MPLPPAQPVRTTLPSAAAPTAVPQDAARSSPVWSFHTCSTGWNRSPNRDVLRPESGIESSASGFAVPTFSTATVRMVGGAVGSGTTEGV